LIRQKNFGEIESKNVVSAGPKNLPEQFVFLSFSLQVSPCADKHLPRRFLQQNYVSTLTSNGGCPVEDTRRKRPPGLTRRHLPVSDYVKSCWFSLLCNNYCPVAWISSRNASDYLPPRPGKGQFV